MNTLIGKDTVFNGTLEVKGAVRLLRKLLQGKKVPPAEQENALDFVYRDKVLTFLA